MLKIFFAFPNYLRSFIRAKRFTKFVFRGNLNLNSKNQLFTKLNEVHYQQKLTDCQT